MVLYERLSSLVESSFLDDTSMHHSSFHNPAAGVSLPPLKKTLSHHGAKSTKSDHSLLVSFVVIYTMIFFNGCCFTAVMPSVPFFLEALKAPPVFLGWVVSFYSLGQILGSPTAGWLLSNGLSSKTLLKLSSTLGLASSVLYALAPGYVYILISRLLTGISAGMEFTTELTFIAQHTSVKERTTYLASVTACNVVGFIMGPALGNVLAILDISIWKISIDQYTGPGWLLATMFLVDLIMIQYLFQEHHALVECDSATSMESSCEPSERLKLLKEEQQRDASYGGLSEDDTESTIRHANTTIKADPPPSLPLVLSLIFVQFTVMFGFSLMETITSPLVEDQFDWNVRDCNLLFTCGGFVSLAAYVIFVVASKWVQDRYLVLYALVLCLTGFLLAIDWQQLKWAPSSTIPYYKRFLAGFMVMNAGFMTGRPVTFALYSKLISPQYQGKYLGWMVAGGSAARTLGPFVAVSLYYEVTASSGYNLLALFGSVGLFHLACLVLVLCQWPQLLPDS